MPPSGSASDGPGYEDAFEGRIVSRTPRSLWWLRDLVFGALAPIRRIQARRRYNNLAFQRDHWRDAIRSQDWESPELYGNDWGNPDEPGGPLGDYREIKRRLVELARPGSVILDIGSLGGKWTQHLLTAERIICVDINELGFEYIRKKLPGANLSFYLTRGNELEGIPSDSVDVVFSMDTLVRVPRQSIRDYVFEAARVLRKGGALFLHLPCSEQPGSRLRSFEPLRRREIEQFCRAAKFRDVRVDTKVISHGVIVEATRA